MRGLVTVVVGVLTMAFAFTTGLQAAHADGPVNFGSYTISSTAPGFEMWEDEPSANAHPEGGGQAPYSTSALNSGQLGYALSSVAWPGATEANADKVALLLFPHSVDVPSGPSVPVPDAVVQLFNTAAPAASYPIRAESRTGSSQPDDTFDAQGATLKAHADPVLAEATATMKGADGAAGFTFGNAHTIATTVLNSTAGQSTAESRITDIDIGGVVKIESVTSNATATTDGTSSSSNGLTVVQGLTIAGQPAYVDDQGVHVGQQGQPANATVNQVVNQALSKGGFTFYVSQPQQETSAATSSYTAGSLFVRWQPPGNPSQNVFLIALGGARVSVAAVPGSGFTVPRPSLPAPTTPAPPSAAATRPGITSSAPTAPPATAPKAGTPVAPIAGSRIAATFDGLGGQASLGLLGAALMYLGCKRAATDIVDRQPSTCPLEST